MAKLLWTVNCKKLEEKGAVQQLSWGAREDYLNPRDIIVF
jgi:hypothetical protein